jgi:uncharacterized tellurite resistance protein B-like protein
MKQHVQTITNLLLGAAYADKKLEGEETKAIEQLLCKLVGSEQLPIAQSSQMRSFSPAAFDAESAAKSLASLDSGDKRKVLEMVCAVHDADEELDFAEDAYLRKVASGLGIAGDDISSLALDVAEVDGMEGILGED